MAHDLGLIDDATNSDLVTINAVRVVFAHAEEPIRFASAPVRKKAETFRDWKSRASARRLFDEAVARAKVAINARTDALLYEHAKTQPR